MHLVRKMLAFLLVLPALVMGGFAACAIAGAFVVLFAAIAGLDELKTMAGAITGFCAVAVFVVLLSPLGEILFGISGLAAQTLQPPGPAGLQPHGGSPPAAPSPRGSKRPARVPLRPAASEDGA